MRVASVAPNGVVLELPGISQTSMKGVITLGDRFVLAYHDARSNIGMLQFRDKELNEPDELEASVVLPAYQPVIGAGPAGFAVAMERPGIRPLFTAFDGAGSVVCDAIPFADASFVPSAVVGTETGYLVVSSGEIRLQHIANDCKLGPLMTLGATAEWGVRAAGGSEGYAVVWQDTATSTPMRRVFGPNFCD